MKIIEALELEPEDYATPAKRDAAVRAMGLAEIVFYQGELVKNLNGKITRRLSEIQAHEQRKGQRVY